MIPASSFARTSKLIDSTFALSHTDTSNELSFLCTLYPLGTYHALLFLTWSVPYDAITVNLAYSLFIFI